MGVEAAERHLDGACSAAELAGFEYANEGAAFNIDYNCAPAALDRWEAVVRAIPAPELDAMLHPPGPAPGGGPRDLLKHAAYFAHYTMVYPSLRPKAPPPGVYRVFLSAADLRRRFAYTADRA